MPLQSNSHAFLHRICEGTEQIRKKYEVREGDAIMSVFRHRNKRWDEDIGWIIVIC